ncbi:thermonuclease family protein [Pseudorhodoplanes sp.]|uniref:thermonuclease family protein n=1 Tax=Pseudorhodoplanes sp. TaxID=1934341 RepID=UPI00391A141B
MMGESNAGALGGAAAVLLALLTISPASAACGQYNLSPGEVTAIEDSRTLRLADGRTIRLAAVEWTVSPDVAKAALSELALGRPVTLRSALTSTPAPDRYGRIHAFAFVSGSETPVQYTLLERGLAIAGSRTGNESCRQALLRREGVARASGNYRLHQANDPEAVLADLGRFAVVEGRVLSVRESGGTIYVNFGRRWSDDFTVTIARQDETAFKSAGLLPKSLAGRTVRVRGVIEERAGPWIEARTADQFDWDGRR